MSKVLAQSRVNRLFGKWRGTWNLPTAEDFAFAAFDDKPGTYTVLTCPGESKWHDRELLHKSIEEARNADNDEQWE